MKNGEESQFLDDAFKEIGNVGAGHAATALSQLLNRRIDISVPRISVITVDDIEKVYENLHVEKNDKLGLIYTKTSGELEIGLTTAFPEKGIIKFLSLLTYSKVVDLSSLTEFEISSVKEIGNILLLHYISSINTFISPKIFIYPKVPEIKLGLSSEIVEDVFSHHVKKKTEMLSIDVDILLEQSKIDATILMIPTKETLDNIASIFFG
ncbi:MAG: chemotaxis protein CheC [Candidatus Hodarchaeales archaeon]